MFVTQLGEQGQSQHTLSDKEGDAERKRELEEEEMAQAGQPQKLEEDLDPQHEAEEEPGQQQPDENAVEGDRGHSQRVSHPLALRTGMRICSQMADNLPSAAG